MTDQIDAALVIERLAVQVADYARRLAIAEAQLIEHAKQKEGAPDGAE